MLRMDRYLSDGTIDASFGAGGSLLINTSPAASVTSDPSSQKIVYADIAGSVGRLNLNGSVDTSFGTNGKIYTGMTINVINVSADGKVLVAGSLTSGSTTLMAVGRLNSNGSLDNTFGSNGRASANFGNGTTAIGYGLQSYPSGEVVVGGMFRLKNSNVGKFAAARFSSTGIADSSFNGTGKVLFDFLGLAGAGHDVAIQSDGKVVMTGSFQVASGVFDFGVVRFNFNGSLDTSFGSNGIALADVDGPNDVSSWLLLSSDPLCACEKVLVIGSSTGGTSYARFTLW